MLVGVEIIHLLRSLAGIAGAHGCPWAPAAWSLSRRLRRRRRASTPKVANQQQQGPDVPGGPTYCGTPLKLDPIPSSRSTTSPSPNRQPRRLGTPAAAAAPAAGQVGRLADAGLTPSLGGESADPPLQGRSDKLIIQAPQAALAADFAALGLSEPLVKAVAAKGYRTPSPIQRQCIPAVLEGRDVMAAAQTGTGKTAGFTLPLLERLRHGPPARAGVVRALVLTPTRELAAQVAESVVAYGRYLELRSDVVFGGVSPNPQISRLRRGTDVLVATPGRLMDLQQQGALKLDRVEILVLDEADRMLDMGFIRDIRRILALMPAQRQNLLFSATFSSEIRQLATGLLHQPVQLQATPENQAAPLVQQVQHPCDMGRKPDLLCHLIQSQDWQQVLVFSRTKHGANRLSERLEQEGISAAAIHGNKSQGARTRALACFKSGEVRVLVATDIAARGIDIQQLPHVVNLDLPNVAEDYVHRIGRTGRAGLTGHAVSLVAAEEHELLRAIERLTGAPLPRQEVPGFEPKVLSAPPLDLSGGRGRSRSSAGGRPGVGRSAGSRPDGALRGRRGEGRADRRGGEGRGGEGRSGRGGGGSGGRGGRAG